MTAVSSKAIVILSAVAFPVEVKPVPPAIVNVSVFESATAFVPPSPAIVLNMFWLEPLSALVISKLNVVPLFNAAETVIPSLPPISNSLEPVKSPRLEPLLTLIAGVFNVASLNINEPSASHWSVAKLYTIECEPVTFDALFACVPTPVKLLVSKPKPPVVGSVFEAVSYTHLTLPTIYSV